jgi:hypothetical protein
MSTQVSSYIFEAASIQEYVLSGARLREMAGASAIIDQLSDSLLDTTLVACKIDVTDLKFVRRSGGAFAFTGEQETLARFARVWPVIVQQHTANLNFDQAIGLGNNAKEAIDNARRNFFAASQSRVPILPTANAIIQRAQRTGEPAVNLDKDNDEVISQSTRLKRKASKTLNSDPNNSLRTKFGLSKQHQWPTKLSPTEIGDGALMPYLSTSDENKQDIAVMHIDGNGLGQFFISALSSLPRDVAEARFPEVALAISTAVDKAVAKAAQAVFKQVWEPNSQVGEIQEQEIQEQEIQEQEIVVPARPLVVAGDDINLVVRADLGLQTAYTFITELSKATETIFADTAAELNELLGVNTIKLPKRLTACAGIAFVKGTHAFSQAYEMAEELTGQAKIDVKRISAKAPANSAPPSGIRFARPKSAGSEGFTGNDRLNSLGTYCCEEGVGLPTVQQLIKLYRDSDLELANGLLHKLGDSSLDDELVKHVVRRAKTDYFKTALAGLYQQCQISDNNASKNTDNGDATSTDLWLDDGATSRSPFEDLAILKVCDSWFSDEPIKSKEEK